MTGRIYDQPQQRIAGRIGRDYPLWLVLWGTHTRRYWGFPRFQAPPGTVITTPDTRELAIRMRHAELAASAQPPPHTTTQNTRPGPEQE